ncbi:hypothetical protein ACHAW6_006357 [Cyclotella cf. meneghiniana]
MILSISNILWDLGIPEQAFTPLCEYYDNCITMADGTKTSVCNPKMDIQYYVQAECVEQDLMILKWSHTPYMRQIT